MSISLVQIWPFYKYILGQGIAFRGPRFLYHGIICDQSVSPSPHPRWLYEPPNLHFAQVWSVFIVSIVECSWGPIQALLSDHCASHRLYGYSMASTKEWWKHSKYPLVWSLKKAATKQSRDSSFVYSYRFASNAFTVDCFVFAAMIESCASDSSMKGKFIQ